MTRTGLTTFIATLGVVAASAIAAPAAMAQTSIDFPLTFDNLPSYDRVNGLSVPFGPTITVGDDERLVAIPMLTYRSHLGKIDPSISIAGQFTSDSTIGLSLRAARGTFSNDGWIRSDLINTVVSFGTGGDSRNYFRADRGEAVLTSNLHMPIDVATVFAGVRAERAWSTGWRSGSEMGPFAILSRSDTVNGIQRPNPEIDAGHITSVIAGAHAEYFGINGTAKVDLLIEAAGSSPAGGSFQQFTLDESVAIPTVRDQHLEVAGHLVATANATLTPRQRNAYLGGAGTFATEDMLQRGGDQLYFLDMLYVIPIEQLQVPILGAAYVAPHFAVGAAGVNGFGVPIQNVGIRVGVAFITADYVVNPRTHAHDFGIGLSLRP
jgi:hypothetical protein